MSARCHMRKEHEPIRPPEGRAQILTLLIAEHSSKLRRQAEKHAQRPDDTEEAIQRACLLFLERYDDRYHPLAWLQTTIKREAWAIRRRSSRRRERGFEDFHRPDGSPIDLSAQFPDDSTPVPDRLVEREELYRRSSLLAQLKPDERDALLLFAYGYSYREIADLRNWTYTKVNRCISEGRAALR